MCRLCVNNFVHFLGILSFYSCIECVKMHNETGHRNGNYANKIRVYEMMATLSR